MCSGLRSYFVCVGVRGVVRVEVCFIACVRCMCFFPLLVLGISGVYGVFCFVCVVYSARLVWWVRCMISVLWVLCVMRGSCFVRVVCVGCVGGGGDLGVC